MSKYLLLTALLALLLSAPPCPVQTPSPADAANLRRLLPFPEETLREKMEMSISFGNWSGECRFRRSGSGFDDDAAGNTAFERAADGV